MKKIMDAEMIERSIKRISYEIIEKNKGTKDLVIIGIKTRGEYLANRIADYIANIEGIRLDVVSYDFTYWRDDVRGEMVSKADIQYDFKDKKVILCDDVIFKGRTIRAAMNGILEHSRASMIQVAVLIDRGHRELPIKADFVGKNVPTSIDESIKVNLKEIDKDDSVFII